MKQKKYTTPSYSKKIKMNESGTNVVLLIPIIFVVAILPFIMRYHIYPTRMTKYPWFPPVDSNIDIFLYYKHILFVIVTIVMLVILGIYFYKNKKNIKLPYICIPLGVYLLFSILSTIFSKNYIFGIVGMFDHFESIFVLLGYGISVFYVIICVKNIFDIEKIFNSLLISITIMNVIGFSQLIGKDLVISELGRQLIFPGEIKETIENFSIGFTKGTVYLTLFNPNYVGGYVGLLLPIIFALLILKRSEIKKIEIVLYVFNILGLALCLYGSGSETGMIGIFVAFIFLIIILWNYIFKNKGIGLAFIAILLSISSIILVSKIDIIKQKFIPVKSEVSLNKIIASDKVEVTYNQNTIYIDYNIDDSGIIELFTVDYYGTSIGNVIDVETGMFNVLDDKFHNFKLGLIPYNEQIALRVQIDGKDWDFVKNEDGIFYYNNIFGKLDEIVTAKSAVFTDYENFASGRGYIWSRTIPLLKKYVVLGSGADTFAIAFPQQDYVGLYNYGFSGDILTKPHNMYLQMGVQTGGVSLIAFIVFYLMYFFESLKLYLGKRNMTNLEPYGVAIFIGTISYMVTGIANDSSITVAPMYWVFMGLGIFINYKVKTDRS